MCHRRLIGEVVLFLLVIFPFFKDLQERNHLLFWRLKNDFFFIVGIVFFDKFFNRY